MLDQKLLALLVTNRLSLSLSLFEKIHHMSAAYVLSLSLSHQLGPIHKWDPPTVRERLLA